MKRMFFVLILVTMVAVSSFITGGLKPSQKQKAALGKQLFFEKFYQKIPASVAPVAIIRNLHLPIQLPLAWV